MLLKTIVSSDRLTWIPAVCVAAVCRAALRQERLREAKNHPEETRRRENDTTTEEEEEEASGQTAREPICGHT